MIYSYYIFHNYYFRCFLTLILVYHSKIDENWQISNFRVYQHNNETRGSKKVLCACARRCNMGRYVVYSHTLILIIINFISPVFPISVLRYTTYFYANFFCDCLSISVQLCREHSRYILLLGVVFHTTFRANTLCQLSACISDYFVQSWR